MANETLKSLLPETFEQLTAQLEEDGKRWGDTWRKRIKQGQEERIYAELNTYYDQFKNAGVPIPWLKIMGEAHIALVREQHPELLEHE